VDADMGVVAAEVAVVKVGVGDVRTGEFGFESGSLRVVAFEEEEEEAEDVVGGVCRCEVLVGVGCWFMVVGSWLLVHGCWFLVAVNVIGCWLLVVGCCWFASLCRWTN